MMNNLSQNQSNKILNSPEEYKIQAALLLKTLKNTSSPDPSAISRISRSPELLDFLKNNKLQLKHVLNLIAQEQGFNTWEDLKKSSEISIQQLFNNYSGGGFLNHWFASYSDAKQYQNNHGGYLLPYENQFFICDENYLNHMGIDPHHPDWSAINFDWANPKDSLARARIYQRYLNNLKNQESK